MWRVMSFLKIRSTLVVVIQKSHQILKCNLKKSKKHVVHNHPGFVLDIVVSIHSSIWKKNRSKMCCYFI